MSEFGNSENSVCRQASMLDINTNTSRHSKRSWLVLLNSLRVARLCMRGVYFNLALLTTLRRLLVPTTFKMSSEKCVALDSWSDYLAEEVDRFAANKRPLLIFTPRSIWLIIAALENESIAI